jgi:hypothetical protein
MRNADATCGVGRHEICAGVLDRSDIKCECRCHSTDLPNIENEGEQ